MPRRLKERIEQDEDARVMEANRRAELLAEILESNPALLETGQIDPQRTKEAKQTFVKLDSIIDKNKDVLKNILNGSVRDQATDVSVISPRTAPVVYVTSPRSVRVFVPVTNDSVEAIHTLTIISSLPAKAKGIITFRLNEDRKDLPANQACDTLVRATQSVFEVYSWESWHLPMKDSEE